MRSYTCCAFSFGSNGRAFAGLRWARGISSWWFRRKNSQGCEAKVGSASWCQPIQTATFLGRWFWDSEWSCFCRRVCETAAGETRILAIRWWRGPKDDAGLQWWWFSGTWGVASTTSGPECYRWPWRHAIAPCRSWGTSWAHSAVAWGRRWHQFKRASGEDAYPCCGFSGSCWCSAFASGS